MVHDYSKNYKDLTRALKKLDVRIPSAMKSFTHCHRASTVEATLSSKTKKLIALCIAITVNCAGCNAYHVNDLLQSGASAEQVIGTLELNLNMGIRSSVVYGFEAMKAPNQFGIIEK